MDKQIISLTRRRVLITGASIAVRPISVNAIENLTQEVQRGDPDIPEEYLLYDRALIADASAGMKGVFEPTPPDFGGLFVSEAAAWVGRNRRHDRDSIALLLDLFDLPFSQGGRPVPFCAAGVSYVAAMVYAKAVTSRSNRKQAIQPVRSFLAELDHSHFYPTPSVNDMVLVARGKRRWISSVGTPPPQTGWLIVFAWTGTTPNHVGIVKSVEPGLINTIEFNTSPGHITNAAEREGGYVAVRARPYPNKAIFGFIKID